MEGSTAANKQLTRQLRDRVPVLVAGDVVSLAAVHQAFGHGDAKFVDRVAQLDHEVLALVVAGAARRGGVDNGHARSSPAGRASAPRAC